MSDEQRRPTATDAACCGRAEKAEAKVAYLRARFGARPEESFDAFVDRLREEQRRPVVGSPPPQKWDGMEIEQDGQILTYVGMTRERWVAFEEWEQRRERAPDEYDYAKGRLDEADDRSDEIAALRNVADAARAVERNASHTMLDWLARELRALDALETDCASPPIHVPVRGEDPVIDALSDIDVTDPKVAAFAADSSGEGEDR